MKTTEILIMREPLWESLAKDTFSCVVLLGLVGVGIWAGSSAMQWAGAVIWMVWMPSKAVSYFNKNKLTIAEARAKLDALEGRQ